MRCLIFFAIMTVLLAACTSTVALSTAERGIPSELSDISLYPGTERLSEGIPGMGILKNFEESHTIYSYIVQDESKNIENFYSDDMQTAGWELLGKTDGGKMGNNLLFAKGDRIVTISILPRTPLTYLVTIDIIIDPAYRN